MHKYTVIVHEEEVEGGYWAEVEGLPGCFGSGDTLDELEKDVRQAIESYLLNLIDNESAVVQPAEPASVDPGEPTLRRWEIAIA